MRHEYTEIVDIEDFKAKSLDFSCRPPFEYCTAVHIKTGDLNITENEFLRKGLFEGGKCHEPYSVDLSSNFQDIMEAVKDYTRKLIKREQENFHLQSKWVKALGYSIW